MTLGESGSLQGTEVIAHLQGSSVAFDTDPVWLRDAEWRTGLDLRFSTPLRVGGG